MIDNFVIDAYGKFTCVCEIQPVNFQLIATPKSVTLECQKCHRKNLYRVVRL